MPDMLEQTTINLGFMPLTDCAPLVVAKEWGFYQKWGLDVSLHKQNSWATLRDKVHGGILDAGQMLAPMPLASTLGLGGSRAHIITPFVLSRNGNAITLSEQLRKDILSTQHTRDLRLPLSACSLKTAIAQRKQIGNKLRFATVYPYSCHYYQLLDWFSSSRIDIADIDLFVVPPAQMVDALEEGQIDGFCVGGPWNAKAVRKGVGMTGLTSSDIWPDFPEKVLGLRADWYNERPNTTQALIGALQEACYWLESVPNRLEAARALCGKEYLNTDLDVVAPSLLGSCLTHVTSAPRFVPSYNQFSGRDQPWGNCPETSTGEWLINKMIEAGHLQVDSVSSGFIASVYRADIFHAHKQQF